MHAIVLVPTYNEQANLREFVERVRHCVPGLHILIIDDNSPDGTGETADELAHQYRDEVFVLHRAKKEGLGSAYVDGFAWVLKKEYKYILQMDADLSHDPGHLPAFFEKIRDYAFCRWLSLLKWNQCRELGFEAIDDE